MNKAEQDVDKIVYQRFFPNITNGICVDVGAASPNFLSVSALFRSLGWKIISVEPNPDFCIQQKAAGYEVLQFACGDHDEDNVDFFVVDSNNASYEGGKVTFEAFSSLGIKKEFLKIGNGACNKLKQTKIQVSLRKLDTLLTKFAPDVKQIDILSIDVEGWELEVLRGLSFERYAPKVVIMENMFNDVIYRKYMSDLGYTLWKHLGVNDIFVV